MELTKERILEATELREEREDLQRLLRRMDEERKLLLGQERAAITRKHTKCRTQVEKLHELLKDLPPDPISPEAARKEAVKELLDAKVIFDEIKEQFLNRFADSPKYAIESAERMIKAEVAWTVCKGAIENTEGYFDLVEQLQAALDRVRSDLLARSRNLANSTSMIHNAVRLTETEAWAHLLRWSSLLHCLCWAEKVWTPGVRAWEILQE